MTTSQPSVMGSWWDWWSFVNEQSRGFSKAVRDLTVEQMVDLSREGFMVRSLKTREEFFLTEALEYINAWQDGRGIIGPIGPVEQLELVARIINTLRIDVSRGWFAGMDEFVIDGKAVSQDHPLSFAA